MKLFKSGDCIKKHAHICCQLKGQNINMTNLWIQNRPNNVQVQHNSFLFVFFPSKSEIVSTPALQLKSSSNSTTWKQTIDLSETDGGLRRWRNHRKPHLSMAQGGTMRKITALTRTSSTCSHCTEAPHRWRPQITTLSHTNPAGVLLTQQDSMQMLNPRIYCEFVFIHHSF